jgi:chemotaxis protein CheD
MSVNSKYGSSAKDAHYVAKGLMKVADAPSIIQTVVGPGYVVAISQCGGNNGGLLHIPSEETSYSNPNCFESSKATTLLKKFYLSLKKLKPDFKRANAYIIGGADILGLLPAVKRDRVISKRIAPIEEELRRWGIKNIKLDIGGKNGRKVVFDISTGCVNVAKTGKSKAGKAINTRPANLGTASIMHQDVTVNMGCLQIAREPVRLSAILGSCVGIALYDQESKIGGLAHVMMPQFPGNGEPKSKYADTAVPELLKKLFKAGAERSQLKAKLAGGANVLFNERDGQFSHISGQNITISQHALMSAGIEIIEEDVGGIIGRKMLVDLNNFEMSIKMLTGAKSVE